MTNKFAIRGACLTLRADTARTPGLRGLGKRTAVALRAVGPATPTECVSYLAQLFIASWVRTRT